MKPSAMDSRAEFQASGSEAPAASFRIRASSAASVPEEATRNSQFGSL